MKTITAAFKSHIQGEVTTTCTCLTIRRRDGATFGLTDHDEPIFYLTQRFVPFDSFSRLSVSNTCDLEVDGLEINGILNSTAVARQDVASGLFDFAEIEVFLLNYEDPTMGKMSLRRGWLGEIEMNENNVFHAEVRGLTQVLSYRVGNPYAPECNADLGDKRCKIGLDPSYWKGLTPYRAGDFVLGHITAPSGYVSADLTNANFGADTGGGAVLLRNPTGWITYGDDNGRWQLSNNFGGLTNPPGSVYFAGITDAVATNDTTTLGMYQDVGLESSGLNLTDVDTGLCRISITAYVARSTDTGQTRFRVYALDANNVSRTIYDTNFKQYALDRWITIQLNNIMIPSGTRIIRVDFTGTKKASEADGAMFGGLIMAFNDPTGNYNSDELSNGVMFQAQDNGITGSTEPAFSNTVGDTFVDGSITWKCVTSFKTVTTVTAVTNNQIFECTLSQEDGYFDGGLMEWESGQNAGHGVSVKTQVGGTITLIQRSFYPIEVGDRLVLHAGCDKREDTCIHKFNNVLNFRGFPDVPGQDAFMQRPEAHTS